MVHGMRATSLEAYEKIKRSLPEKRSEILRLIEKRIQYGATLFELVRVAERPINEISGRVTELAAMGLIKDKGRRINPKTNKAATVWVAVGPEEFGGSREEICS